MARGKVAIFLPSLFGAGGQRSMLNLAHGMAACGHQVDLVLAQAEGAFLKDVRPSIRLVNLNASRVLTSLPALVRYLRQEKPAAMLSVFGYVNIVALWAWRLAGVPTRLYVNEQNTVSQESGNAANWRSRMTPLLMKRFYPWANGIIVVSEGVRRDMARVTNIPRDRITVIYNPSIVQADVWQKAQAPLAHPWLLPDEPPIIVAVGRLQPQKDYTTLLDAFSQLRGVQPARLLILGEGKERALLEKTIREKGLAQDVSLPGFVDNPFAYMSRAALFVLSSRWEGLPTVLIEALCCGTPVVSTDCPSGPREILQDGRFGELVPVGDANALAKAMLSVLQDGCPAPPPESWQPYELDNVVTQYLALLANK